MCEKPTISEDQGYLEPHLLDKLIDNISMLSSVYYKPPETFVKKIRDRINERLDDEVVEEEVQDFQKDHNEYVDSMGVKKSEWEQQENVDDYNAIIALDLGGNDGQIDSRPDNPEIREEPIVLCT